MYGRRVLLAIRTWWFSISAKQVGGEGLGRV